jgi:hypothetical protein
MEDIRKGTCPLCEHEEIIRCKPVDFAPPTLTDSKGVVPLAATHVSRFFGGPNPRRPVGVFHAFVCRACGYSQWFAGTPKEIPIGSEWDTDLITPRRPEPQGPYR